MKTKKTNIILGYNLCFMKTKKTNIILGYSMVLRRSPHVLFGILYKHNVLMWMMDEQSTNQKRMNDCMRNFESGNGKNSQETSDFFSSCNESTSISYVRLPQKSEKFTYFFLSIFRIMVVF